MQHDHPYVVNPVSAYSCTSDTNWDDADSHMTNLEQENQHLKVILFMI